MKLINHKAILFLYPYLDSRTFFISNVRSWYPTINSHLIIDTKYNFIGWLNKSRAALRIHKLNFRGMYE